MKSAFCLLAISAMMIIFSPLIISASEVYQDEDYDYAYAIEHVAFVYTSDIEMLIDFEAIIGSDFVVEHIRYVYAHDLDTSSGVVVPYFQSDVFEYMELVIASSVPGRYHTHNSQWRGEYGRWPIHVEMSLVVGGHRYVGWLPLRSTSQIGTQLFLLTFTGFLVRIS